MAAVTRRQYKGAAAPCTTTNSLTSADTSVTLSAITGWPSTAAVPFFVVIDPGTSSEEKCSATISGSTLTLTRGQDDTTAVAHSSGATIYPVFSADDADEANNMAATMTTKGDLLVTTGSAFNRLAVGTNGFGLIADSASTNGVKWGTPYNSTVSTKTANYTLVAADVGTRVVMNAGATDTTITVNTSLFAAGDTLEILNTSTSGICTITAGTATVSSASSLALGKNAGGKLYFTSAGVSVFQATDSGDGLAYISTTSYSSDTINFQGCFTSAYTNYRAIFRYTVASASAVYMRYLIGASASTSTIYSLSTATQHSVPNTFSGSNRSDQFALWGTGYPTYPTVVTCDFLSPQVLAYTNYQYSHTTGLSSTDYFAGQGFGRNASTDQLDGFQLYSGSPIITGTLTLYGYRK